MRTALLSAALVVFVSCGTIGTFSSQDMAVAVDAIQAKTEDYVAKDTSLTDVQRAELLAPSLRINAVLTATERVSVSQIATDVDALTTTHDRYVNADTSISESQRSMRLATSQELRELMELPQ